MRLSVVGCSGSVPGPRSPASCYLIEADVEADVEGEDGLPRTWRLLLDLGNGALGPLQSLVDPADLDAVLVSHLHPDHYADLCSLYVLLRHGPRRRRGLSVWGPPGTDRRLAHAYGTSPTRGLSDVFDVAPYPAEPFRVGPFTVTAVPVAHPVPAYGLRIEHGGRVLAYTGDTDACPNLATLLGGADLVLADSAFVEGRDAARGIHLTGRRAAEAALDAGGVGRLVLTHVSPWTDPQVCLDQAREVWTGPLEVAVAGATYDV